MENDSDSSFAPSFSPSMSISSTDHTETRLLDNWSSCGPGNSHSGGPIYKVAHMYQQEKG